MTGITHSISYRFFARWASFSYQNSIWVILSALLVVSLSVVYTANNLGVHTDTTEMLSEELPFRANDKRYESTFPQHRANMLLVLDAPTPEQAYINAKQLTAHLQQDSVHIQNAFYAQSEPFLARNGLLYKSISELEQITDRLAAAQPLVARIAEKPTLHTFASVLTEAVDELRTGRKLELDAIFNGVSATLDAQHAGAPRALSWQTLFSGEQQRATYQEMIVVQPKLDYSELFAAQQPLMAIRAAAEEIGLADEVSSSLRITGEAALAYDELNSAMFGAQDAGLIALLMVTIVLFLALRTVGAILTVLLSLIFGLLLTAAFATFAVGHLNLISIAFAVLYIGLGVDYAIHFLLRFQEVKATHSSVSNALYAASGDVGKALAICAITTAIGFYAFMPTTYEGVAELGVIAGSGMIISLIVTLTIASALQRYLPIRTNQIKIGTLYGKLLELPLKFRKSVFVLTFLALLAAISVLPQIKFDYNLLNLNDPQSESVQTFRELLAEADDSPWHAIVLANDQQETESLVSRLTSLPEVDKVVTILDLVPENQEQKQFLIEEMALTLGPIAFSGSWDDTSDDITQQRTALETLHSALNKFLNEQPDHSAVISIRKLSASLMQLLSSMDVMGTENIHHQRELLQAVSRDLLDLLPLALERLQISLEAEPFIQQAIPESLKEQWLSKDNLYRIAIYPAENINDNDALHRFVRAIQQEAPQATGAPVISLEAGEAVVDAFIYAFSLALVGITLALLLLLRSFTATILVLIPLLLAALFTSVATVVFNIPFNFANIIALPLLLGIGIDSSIHMVHRSRQSSEICANVLHTSTARAIYFSALTTLVGFGSLAFSPHQGTASMGLLLAVGVIVTLICVLVILPALLHSSDQD